MQENFKFYYLYGLVNANPNFSLRDSSIAHTLYKKVIGDTGGIFIGNALHPYSIVNRDDCSIWQFAFLYTFQNNPQVIQNVVKGELMLIELASKFSEVLVWPKDTRLTYEDNPIFSNAVPFIIPFIVYDAGNELVFNRRILDEVQARGDAHHYLEELNAELKKFMHPTAFAIGLDEWDEHRPQKIIDNFINIPGLLDSGV